MMLDEIKKGHQIYIVAPLIEESDKKFRKRLQIRRKVY